MLNISETVRDTGILQRNTNMDSYTPYSRVSFRMTLSDLAKYFMTRSVARSLRQLSFLLKNISDLVRNEFGSVLLKKRKERQLELHLEVLVCQILLQHITICYLSYLDTNTQVNEDSSWSNGQSLDLLRQLAFASSSGDLRSIPPTEDAFLWALYQLAIYKRAHFSEFDIPPPTDYGKRVLNGVLLPFTMRFYRATRMHSADYAVARCLSVRLSVCPSHGGIVSNRLYTSSNCFHYLEAPSFWFFRTKRDDNSPTGTPPPLRKHRMHWRVWKKSRFSTNMSLYLGIDAR